MMDKRYKVLINTEVIYENETGRKVICTYSYRGKEQRYIFTMNRVSNEAMDNFCKLLGDIFKDK